MMLPGRFLSYITLIFAAHILLGQCLPILHMHVKRLKFRDGNLLILEYLDYAENQRTVIPLDCKTPLADVYRWKIDSKLGSPYAAHMKLGSPKPRSIYEPWLVDLSQSEYPWALLVVTCRAMVEGDHLLTRVWVIAKMRSSASAPYHPTICEYDDAQCTNKKFDCSEDLKGQHYYGTWDRDESGSLFF